MQFACSFLSVGNSLFSSGKPRGRGSDSMACKFCENLMNDMCVLSVIQIQTQSMVNDPKINQARGFSGRINLYSKRLKS